VIVESAPYLAGRRDATCSPDGVHEARRERYGFARIGLCRPAREGFDSAAGGFGPRENGAADLAFAAEARAGDVASGVPGTAPLAALAASAAAPLVRGRPRRGGRVGAGKAHPAKRGEGA
jgi:hypothetical protein